MFPTASGLDLLHPSSFRQDPWASITDLFPLCWWISYKRISPNKLCLFILMDFGVMPLSDTLITKWKWQKRMPLIICLHWTKIIRNNPFIYDMCDQHNYLPFSVQHKNGIMNNVKIFHVTRDSFNWCPGIKSSCTVCTVMLRFVLNTISDIAYTRTQTHNTHWCWCAVLLHLSITSRYRHIHTS